MISEADAQKEERGEGPAGGGGASSIALGGGEVLAIADLHCEKQTETIDLELREHRLLVETWFVRAFPP